MRLILEDELRIPEDAQTFEGFERWLESGDFPETGRIDFLAGNVEVDLSPEDLFTHNGVKVAIGATLASLVIPEDRGDVFLGGARFTSHTAEISVEPDVQVILSDSLISGQVRLIPSPHRGSNRFSGFAGAPDLVVEIVSDESAGKDTKRLPPLYARAGVPELWTVDARGEELRFGIETLRGGTYVGFEPDADGWLRSPRLGGSFRLTRRRADPFPWRYTLEHRN